MTPNLHCVTTVTQGLSGAVNGTVCRPLMSSPEFANDNAAPSFGVSLLVPMASRVWHIRAVTPPGYAVPRPYSVVGAWVGSIVVLAIAGITIAAFVAANTRLRVNAIQAAQTAHELTVRAGRGGGGLGAVGHALYSPTNYLHSISCFLLFCPRLHPTPPHSPRRSRLRATSCATPTTPSAALQS